MLSTESALTQWPSSVIPMSRTSYFSLSIWLATLTTDMQETSCSEDWPPKITAIVRYVVPGVVNERVVIEEVTYEERDGTGDVYAKIYLKASPALEAITTESGNAGAGTGSAANSTGRSDPETAQPTQTYTVVAGDCLSVICRRFYGNGTAACYNALAAYNGIKNPHLIYPGQVLTIPPKAQLGVSG